MHIGDITTWARGTGLEIVLLIVGAALAGRFVHWLSGRYVKRLERRAHRQPEDDVMPDDAAKHLRTLAQAAEWLAIGVLYFVAALFVLAKFQLPVTSLVVPATAIGAAIGFGAQRVVQDLLAGFFVFPRFFNAARCAAASAARAQTDNSSVSSNRRAGSSQ